jgi:hypothetical protein
MKYTLEITGDKVVMTDTANHVSLHFTEHMYAQTHVVTIANERAYTQEGLSRILSDMESWLMVNGYDLAF